MGPIASLTASSVHPSALAISAWLEPLADHRPLELGEHAHPLE
jgi:hypothetical protein